MADFNQILIKYIEIFKEEEPYFVNDIKNLDLFQKYPQNTDRDAVITKMSSLNHNDINHHDLQDAMVDHILALKIDKALENQDIDIVVKIAALQAAPENLNLLHFASEYCNFHKPEVFPIYSEQHFKLYEAYIQHFKPAGVDPNNLKDYHQFVTTIKDVVKRYDSFANMNYLEMRKFGWLYTEDVINQLIREEEQQ